MKVYFSILFFLAVKSRYSSRYFRNNNCYEILFSKPTGYKLGHMELKTLYVRTTRFNTIKFYILSAQNIVMIIMDLRDYYVLF